MPVLALDLPAGSWAITATITALGSDIAPASAALVFCRILGGSGAQSGSQTMLSALSGTHSQETMPIIGARTLSSAGQVIVTCDARPLSSAVPSSQILVRTRAAILAQAVDPLTSEEPVG